MTFLCDFFADENAIVKHYFDQDVTSVEYWPSALSQVRLVPFGKCAMFSFKYLLLPLEQTERQLKNFEYELKKYYDKLKLNNKTMIAAYWNKHKFFIAFTNEKQ